MSFTVRLLSLCFLSYSAGCASLGSRSGFDSNPSLIYPGAVLDCRLVVDPYYINFSETGRHPDNVALGPRILCVLDLPLSAVLDTLCLPYDIYAWAADDESER